MNPRLLVLRVDGGAHIGWGHVVRCFALAQAWIDNGGTATVASAQFPPEWVARFNREGIAVREPAGAAAGEAAWVTVDGYHIAESERRAIESAGSLVLVIDDHALSPATRASLVVDQNLGATAPPYRRRGDGAELLLGTHYALLRREFRRKSTDRRPQPERARRLLVSVGGAPSPAAVAAFHSVLAQELLAGMELVTVPGVDGVASVLASADLALAASGSTCWELCCLGVPAVLVSMADNQIPLVRALSAHGAAVSGGAVDTIDPPQVARVLASLATDREARVEMSRRGRRLVDGRGAERIVARMRAALLQLRDVRPGDAALLGVLDDAPGCGSSSSTCVASTQDGRPVGVLRFDRHGATADIRLGVASDRVNERWGPAIVNAGVRRLFDEDHGLTAVTARLRSEDTAALTSFDDASFVFSRASHEGPRPWVEHIRYRDTSGAEPVLST